MEKEEEEERIRKERIECTYLIQHSACDQKIKRGNPRKLLSSIWKTKNNFFLNPVTEFNEG